MNGPRRHLLVNDSAGGDDRSFADPNPGQHNGASADPNVPAHNHVPLFHPAVAVGAFTLRAVVRSRQQRARPDKDILAYVDPPVDATGHEPR